MLFRAGVPRHAIIKKFAGEEISCVEELISVLSKLSRGARVPLEYISYMDRHRRKVMVTMHSRYMILKIAYLWILVIPVVVTFVWSCFTFLNLDTGSSCSSIDDNPSLIRLCV